MKTRKILREVSADSITFTVVDTGESFVANLNELPEESVKMLVARAVNTSVGNNIPPSDMSRIDYMQQVWEHLKQGTFSLRRNTGKTVVPTNFIKALMKVYDKDLEEVLLRVAELTDEEVKEHKADPRVKAAMQTIRADNARAKAKAADKEAKKAENTLTL